MHMQVQEAIVKVIKATQFITMSCDEITIIDNGSWICTHAYVVQLWVKVPIMLQIECIMDGLGSNNLTKIIIVAWMKYGGLTREDMSKTLLCFGVDGAFVFKRGGGEGGTSVTR